MCFPAFNSERVRKTAYGSLSELKNRHFENYYLRIEAVELHLADKSLIIIVKSIEAYTLFSWPNTVKCTWRGKTQSLQILFAGKLKTPMTHFNVT